MLKWIPVLMVVNSCSIQFCLQMIAGCRKRNWPAKECKCGWVCVQKVEVKGESKYPSEYLTLKNFLLYILGPGNKREVWNVT